MMFRDCVFFEDAFAYICLTTIDYIIIVVFVEPNSYILISSIMFSH